MAVDMTVLVALPPPAFAPSAVHPLITGTRSLTSQKRPRSPLSPAFSVTPNRSSTSFSIFTTMSTSTTPLSEQDLSLESSDGVTIGAFLVQQQEPPTMNHNPRALILMTDILGYKDADNRKIARRFASAGFTVIIPDLFREKPWTKGRDMSEYEQWRAQHHPDIVRNDLLLSRDELSSRALASNLGLIGFCFGGGRLMEELARGSDGIDPKAAVAFYPTRFDSEYAGRNIRCPLLLQTGDQDHLVPMSVVDTLRTTLHDNQNLTEWKVDVFDGFGHAFAHHPVTKEDEAQSEIALNNAIDWFQRHI